MINSIKMCQKQALVIITSGERDDKYYTFHMAIWLRVTDVKKKGRNISH